MARYIDITPDVSLLGKVGRSGHSVAEAVAELVDNAVDARSADGPVTVSVSYSSREGWLEVRDNGRGMNRRQLSDALILGLSGKGADSIGKFGLGMKTACTSLGARFRITTTEPAAGVAWIAEYDEDEFMREGKWALPIRRAKKPWPAGTAVLVESERIYSGLSVSLARHLGWTFRHFIDNGVLQLTVNASGVRAGKYEIDHESLLPMEGEVEGLAVRGWAGLLLKSSQRGWYGLALIRRNRIIRRHEKLGFQAHPSTARVVGELHLNDFPTNNLKTDFIRETAAWRLLEEWVSKSLAPVLSASRALAHAGVLHAGLRNAIERERERVLEGNPALVLPRPSEPTTGDEGSSVDAVTVAIGPFTVEHRFVYRTPLDPPAHLRVGPGDAQRIRVTSNLASPLTSVFRGAAEFACFNMADVITREASPPAAIEQSRWAVLEALSSDRALMSGLRASATESRRSADAGASERPATFALETLSDG